MNCAGPLSQVCPPAKYKYPSLHPPLWLPFPLLVPLSVLSHSFPLLCTDMSLWPDTENLEVFYFVSTELMQPRNLCRNEMLWWLLTLCTLPWLSLITCLPEGERIPFCHSKWEAPLAESHPTGNVLLSVRDQGSRPSTVSPTLTSFFLTSFFLTSFFPGGTCRQAYG